MVRGSVKYAEMSAIFTNASGGKGLKSALCVHQRRFCTVRMICNTEGTFLIRVTIQLALNLNFFSMISMHLYSQYGLS